MGSSSAHRAYARSESLLGHLIHSPRLPLNDGSHVLHFPLPHPQTSVCPLVAVSQRTLGLWGCVLTSRPGREKHCRAPATSLSWPGRGDTFKRKFGERDIAREDDVRTHGGHPSKTEARGDHVESTQSLTYRAPAPAWTCPDLTLKDLGLKPSSVPW